MSHRRMASLSWARLEPKVLGLLQRHAETLCAESLGQGCDPYIEDGSVLRFPMAVGLYVRALAECSDKMVPRRAKLIEAGIEHLRKIKGESGAWGLPFAWKDCVAGTPATITTAIAAAGLLAVARQEISLDVKQDLIAASEWLCHGVPWEPHPEGACPWFAKGWPALVNNVASKAGGVLMDAGMLLGRSDYIERGVAAAGFVCAQQRCDGSWTYGLETKRSPRSTDVIDCAHTAYIVEGLLRILSGREALPGTVTRRIDDAVNRGLAFVEKDLCGTDGLREKVWILSEAELQAMHARASATREWPARRTADGTYIVLHPEEPRLWSLGALLTLHGGARCDGKVGLVTLEQIIDCLDALIGNDGRFRYRSDDDRVFVRHEAHVFAGLADILAMPESCSPTSAYSSARDA